MCPSELRFSPAKESAPQGTLGGRGGRLGRLLGLLQQPMGFLYKFLVPPAPGLLEEPF